MIKGTLYAATDINLALHSMATSVNTKVLYIGELNNAIPQGFIECSVLLPPYEAVSAEIDGNIQMFEDIYGRYLSFTEPCYGMFASIIIALNRGVNIILYIENGDELSHFNFLLKYIEGTFGITTGTSQTPFMYNNNFDWLISSIMYSYMDGFIPEDVFIRTQVNVDNIFRLDQGHMFIKPLTKLFEKYKHMIPQGTNLMQWFINYQQMLILYGNIVPGQLITIDEGED